VIVKKVQRPFEFEFRNRNPIIHSKLEQYCLPMPNSQNCDNYTVSFCPLSEPLTGGEIETTLVRSPGDTNTVKVLEASISEEVGTGELSGTPSQPIFEREETGVMKTTMVYSPNDPNMVKLPETFISEDVGTGDLSGTSSQPIFEAEDVKEIKATLVHSPNDTNMVRLPEHYNLEVQTGGLSGTPSPPSFPREDTNITMVHPAIETSMEGYPKLAWPTGNLSASDGQAFPRTNFSRTNISDTLRSMASFVTKRPLPIFKQQEEFTPREKARPRSWRKAHCSGLSLAAALSSCKLEGMTSILSRLQEHCKYLRFL